MAGKVKSIDPYDIKGIHVERFRAMGDLDIELGQRVTVIAGQNGTGKSTLLGMLGQPFGLRDARTIFDKTFSAKFTDIFNMSPSHDIPGRHLYFVDFNDESIPGAQDNMFRLSLTVGRLRINRISVLLPGLAAAKEREI